MLILPTGNRIYVFTGFVNISKFSIHKKLTRKSIFKPLSTVMRLLCNTPQCITRGGL